MGLNMNQEIEIKKLFVSGGHRFVGRHGKGPREHVMEERESIECVAGKGIIGDRFFDYKEDYKGQLTFFSDEVYQDMLSRFPGIDRDPSVFRRNVLIAGVELNDLIGRRFSIGDVEMLAVEEASPCYWMNEAFCDGAEEALRGRGGLRVRLLTDGVLSVGFGTLALEE